MFVTIAVFSKAARLVKVPSLGRSVPHSSRMLGFSCLPEISSSNSAKLHETPRDFFFPVKKLVSRWTLLGHSERRTKYGETDEDRLSFPFRVQGTAYNGQKSGSH